MAKRTFTGTCFVCKSKIAKGDMTRHLADCQDQAEAKAKNLPPKSSVFRLVVEGHDQPAYWLYLNAPAARTLGDLDAFLRKTWVECCGHMSQFVVGSVRYVGAGEGSWDDSDDDLDGDKNMDVRLDKVLRPDLAFTYEYDFGTTTELALRVIAKEERPTAKNAIAIIARNDPPAIACEVCGKPATKVCAVCACSGEAWYCAKCARKHDCGEEAFLPVVNSPRVGMCGYTG